MSDGPLRRSQEGGAAALGLIPSMPGRPGSEAAGQPAAQAAQRDQHSAQGRHARAPLGRVNTPDERNPPGCCGVVPYMDPISEVHVTEPGLAVIDVAGADDATVFAVQAALAAQWATTSGDRTTRDVGQPGVRLRCYLDLRQPLDS